MHCIHLALAFLSLSFCHQEATPVRLPGVWVGMLEAGGDLQFIRAEFVRGRSRTTGTLHLAGTGDLTLVKASESDGYICFVMRRGDDEFVFAGILDGESITGRVLHGGEQVPFELHRTLEIEARPSRPSRGSRARP
ncbi:MAG TPA: hypothetical protein VEP66_03465 [Myxococcales bacterium]|nr:hypothetical protein [Myxococcales bacterium]